MQESSVCFGRMKLNLGGGEVNATQQDGKVEGRGCLQRSLDSIKQVTSQNSGGEGQIRHAFKISVAQRYWNKA